MHACARISITAANIIPVTPAARIESPIMLIAKPSQYVDDISAIEGARPPCDNQE